MWKTLGGRCIYQSPSGATVHQNAIYRWLKLNSDAIQTLINRRSPQKPELGYIKHLGFSARTQPGRCCLIGLGGAAVAHSIADHTGMAELDAIESNIEVIDIAKKYFMTEQLKHLSITHQDAGLFVQRCTHQYQHLLVDLFNAHSFPEHCNTNDFFANCRRLLLPQGVLAVNLANLDEQWPVFQHIRNSFDRQTIALPVKGSANMVILAYNHSRRERLLEIMQKTNELKKLSWDAHWGCVAEL